MKHAGWQQPAVPPRKRRTKPVSTDTLSSTETPVVSPEKKTARTDDGSAPTWEDTQPAAATLEDTQPADLELSDIQTQPAPEPKADSPALARRLVFEEVEDEPKLSGWSFFTHIV